MVKKDNNSPHEEIKTKNTRTDKYAKAKLKTWLESKGYENVRITNSPTDLEADKDNKHCYIELKTTATDNDIYFGAATITEWVKSLKDEEENELIFALGHAEDKNNDENTSYDFETISLDEMEYFSTIPPFKINFNLPLDKDKREEKMGTTKRQSKALRFSKDLVNPLYKLHEALKDDEKRKDIIQFVEKLNNKNK